MTAHDPAAQPEGAPTFEDVLAEHAMDSAMFEEHIYVTCTGCGWRALADGTQGEQFRAHVAQALRSAGAR